MNKPSHLVPEIERDIDLLVKQGGLLDHLHVMIGVSVRNSANETHAKIKGQSSAPPWDGTHAGVYFTVLAEAVELEQDLRYRLTSRLQRDRGRTHEAGKAALRAIAALSSQQSEDVLRQTSQTVRGWVRTINSTPAIDAVTRNVRLQATCPFCERPTLFVPFDASGDVVCRNPACTNPEDDDKPYRWPRHDWVRLLESTTTQGA